MYLNNKGDNDLMGLVKESTEKTRSAVDTNIAKGINKIAELIRSTPLGIKIDTYIAERPYKLEKAINEMKKKYEKIPLNKRVEPSSYIALQTINNLNYALDEDYLREMFENIIVSDMNQDNKNLVQPGYIDLVKQLSKMDALFLKNLKKKNLIKGNPLMRLKLVDKQSHSYNYLTNSIICLTNGDFIEIPTIIQENLLRLKIIDINYSEYYTDQDAYEKTFKKAIETQKIKEINYSEDKKIDYRKGKMEFTEFGKNFIKICVS